MGNSIDMEVMPYFSSASAFNSPSASFTDVDYEVKYFSWQAIGGPYLAEIMAYGEPVAIWKLLEKLREPVVIKNNRGDRLWWGMVSSVIISGNGLSMDDMANEVRVGYLDTPIGISTNNSGLTYTPWASDADSISRYGTKQLSMQSVVNNQVAALQLRDNLLEDRRYPVALTSNLTPVTAYSALIKCIGWWNTIDWRYYANPAGLESYSPFSLTNQPFGNDSSTTTLQQSFNLSHSWNIYKIYISIRTEETPTDDVRVSIYDSQLSGLPNAELDFALIPASQLNNSLQWLEVNLSGAVTLTAGLTYWIIITRSGVVDSSNYYVVSIEEEGNYPNGGLFTETPRTFTGGDLAFSLVGGQETSDIIADILTDTGQFFQSVNVDTPSGIIQPQYRDGSLTGLGELVSGSVFGQGGLMQLGTSNNRRYLSRVDFNRRVTVYEEPAKPINDTSVLELVNSNVFDPDQAQDKPSYILRFQGGGQAGGTVIESSICPQYVGRWAIQADLRDALGRNRNASLKPEIIFLERMDYTVKNGIMRPYPKITGTPYDL